MRIKRLKNRETGKPGNREPECNHFNYLTNIFQFCKLRMKLKNRGKLSKNRVENRVKKSDLKSTVFFSVSVFRFAQALAKPHYY